MVVWMDRHLDPKKESQEPFPFKVAQDASSATWITERLQTFGLDITSVVPAGFAAYARVYHPARRYIEGQKYPVRWAEVAAATGKRTHRLMQWPSISGADTSKAIQPSGYEEWTDWPDEGHLPSELSHVLSRVLEPFTATPELCWFAVWNGFGLEKPEILSAPTFKTPERVYRIFYAPTTAATNLFSDNPLFPQSANLWWPEDHSWCVATEIDLMCTYVAGSKEAVEAVVSNSELEADSVKPSDRIDEGSDMLNHQV